MTISKALVLLAGLCASFGVWRAANAAPASADQRVLSLITGRPAFSDDLGPEGHAPMKVRRKRNARVAWINEPLLREMYFETYGEPCPLDHEQLKALVLDGLGYAVPLEGEPEADYSNEEREVYADRYGGMGTGAIKSQGSGRAASAAQVQIKGIGRTPLANPPGSRDHSDGFLVLQTGLVEAFWGEYLSHELPWAANRTLAVIDLGSDLSGGRRGLMVRVDPLRPSHLFFNKNAPPDLEKRRLRANFDKWQKFLPRPRQGEFTLANSLFEFADRQAEQYAALYMRRLFHGNMSAGNMMLDGGSLDLTSMTSQSGYAPVTYSTPNLGFGDGEHQTMKEVLLTGLHRNIRRYASPELVAQLPPEAELYAHFDRSYQREVRRAMLRLTGFPSDILTALQDDPSARDLADTLVELGRERTDAIELWLLPNGQNTEGANQLYKILPRAAERLDLSPKELDEALKTVIGNPVLRARFALNYSRVARAALSSGYGVGALKTHAVLASRLLNMKQPNLDERMIGPQADAVVKQWLAGDANAPTEWIETKLREERRIYRDVPAGILVLAEGAGREDLRQRVIYDAKADRYFYELRLKKSAGTLVVGGRLSRIEPRVDAGGVIYLVPLGLDGGIPKLSLASGRLLNVPEFKSERYERVRDWMRGREAGAQTHGASARGRAPMCRDLFL